MWEYSTLTQESIGEARTDNPQGSSHDINLFCVREPSQLFPLQGSNTYKDIIKPKLEI